MTATTILPGNLLSPSKAVWELADALDCFDGPIPLDMLVSLLERSDLYVQDMGIFGVFREDRYARNLIRESAHYELYCMCWRSGQSSTIHDHGVSQCAVRVLEGVMTNIEFELTEPGFASPQQSLLVYPGGIDGKADDGIHQIANVQPIGEDLMTLHVYSPPLRKMNIFQHARLVHFS